MLAQRQLALAQAAVAESLRLEVVRTLDTWLVVGHQESVFLLDNKCGDPDVRGDRDETPGIAPSSLPLKHGEDMEPSACPLLL